MHDLSVQVIAGGRSRLARLLRALRGAWSGSARTATPCRDRVLEDSEWLAALSHEMRSPLQAFSGWLEVLRSQDLEPGERQLAIDGLQRSLRAQSGLAEDLLHVSRMLVGELPVERAPLTVSAVLGSTVKAVTPLADAKGVVIETSLAECPPIEADRALLSLVFEHLLTNAVTRTPRGALVRVQLQAAPERAAVRVEDGGGASPGLWRTLERGYKQGSYARRAMLARHIVERHGGTLEHASTEAGVAFVVRLPIA